MIGRYAFAGTGAILILGLVVACEFSPTAPFDGFDEMGSRVSGRFVSEADSSQNLTAHPQTTFQNMTVHVRRDPSISTSVGSNGRFTLEGIPDGKVTLVFELDGQVIGEIHLDDVRPNQEIRIVLEITINLIIRLVEQDRDAVDFTIGCAKSPSFWCRAANGRSSELSAEEFAELAQQAAGLLSGIPELETPQAVADAVCRKNGDHDRFLRELAALALNIAGGLDEGAPLERGERFSNIGDAFEAARDLARGNPSPGELDDMEEVIEDVNDNENTMIPGCEDDDSSEDSKSEDSKSNDSASGSSSSG